MDYLVGLTSTPVLDSPVVVVVVDLHREDYKCFLPDPPRSIMSKLHIGTASNPSNTESFVCIRAREGRTVERECERVRRLGGAI